MAASPSKMYRVEGTKYGRPFRLVVQSLARQYAIEHAFLRHNMVVTSCVQVDGPVECPAACAIAVAWARENLEA